MSVDLKSSIEASGVDPSEFVRDPKHLAAVEFKAQVPREIQLSVGREPLDDNPHHGEVWRIGRKRFTKLQQNTLLGDSRWLTEIPGVYLGR